MAQLLTERDASKVLCLSVRTLQKWRLCGRGPRFLKLGHAVRYDLAELKRFPRRFRARLHLRPRRRRGRGTWRMKRERRSQYELRCYAGIDLCMIDKAVVSILTALPDDTPGVYRPRLTQARPTWLGGPPSRRE